MIGNNEGLIPAFNVYLANMPQDVYCLIYIGFLEEMNQLGLGYLANNLLIEDAEHCALNIFNGVLHSDEWNALVAPMVKEDRDIIFGLVAVANAFGWGEIHVQEHSSRKMLILVSNNGYEACGYMQLRDLMDKPRCHMLPGVTAGLAELVYEKGEIDERAGIYTVKETECLCCQDQQCRFVATYAE